MRPRQKIKKRGFQPAESKGLDEEEDIDDIPTSPIRSNEKCRMSTYNMPYQRASTFELDAYKNRGIPQPKKHTSSACHGFVNLCGYMGVGKLGTGTGHV